MTEAAGPEAGAAVMATGIVSVAMHSGGHEELSLALLVIAAVAWTVLGVLFTRRLCVDRGRWRREAERLSSLTAVAGTAVLGARLTLLGWSGPAGHCWLSLPGWWDQRSVVSSRVLL